ncbi:MAG: ATP-binding protein [Streptosporangiaceae bacterium]
MPGRRVPPRPAPALPGHGRSPRRAGRVPRRTRQHTGSGKPGGLVVVQVSRWRLGVRIAVTDQGSPGHPVIRAPGTSGELAEDGNGLYLADHLADRLDWHDDAPGRTICAVLGQLPPHSPHRPAQPAQCPRLPQPA